MVFKKEEKDVDVCLSVFLRGKMSYVDSPSMSLKYITDVLLETQKEEPELKEAVLLGATVVADGSDIKEGSLILKMYRPDIQETGYLYVTNVEGSGQMMS